MISKIEGIMIAPNDTERQILTEILELADGQLATLPRLPKDPASDHGSRYDEKTSLSMRRSLISYLRTELGIPQEGDERD